MVMERRPLPDTHVLAAFLVVFIDLRLHDDTHALHEEDAAENRHHQLFMNHHGAYTDDTSYGQATRVAQEDLCGKTVEPEIADQRSDKRCEEDY